MQQQLAPPNGIDLVAASMTVGAEVGSDEEDLAVGDARVGLLEIDLPRAGALDLGAEQDDPALDPFVQVVVM